MPAELSMSRLSDLAAPETTASRGRRDGRRTGWAPEGSPSRCESAPTDLREIDACGAESPPTVATCGHPARAAASTTAQSSPAALIDAGLILPPVSVHRRRG